VRVATVVGVSARPRGLRRPDLPTGSVCSACRRTWPTPREMGLREGAFFGALGYPVDDVTIELLRLEFLSGTPRRWRPKVAAAKAFHEASEKGKPTCSNR